MINPKDPRLQKKHLEATPEKKEENPNEIKVKETPNEPSHMFFRHNPALGPPYRLLLDTNFINFSI